VKTARV